MMTKIQAILGHIAEECNEVAQRALKAQRFGLDDVQAGQSANNRERLRSEFADLVGTYEALVEAGLVEYPSLPQIDAKKAKMAKYTAYAQERGMIEHDNATEPSNVGGNANRNWLGPVSD